MRAFLPAVRILGLLAGTHAAAHPVRTALTVIGVSLGVAAPVAIDFANRDVLRSFQRAVVEAAGASTLEVSGGEVGIKEEVIARIRAHPKVQAALPVVQRPVRDTQTGAVLTVLGTDLLDIASVKQVRWRDSADSRVADTLLEETLFVGGRLAESWGVRVGAVRTFDLGTETRPIRIGGVLDSAAGSESVWDTMAVMDIAPAQDLFGSVGRLDRIDIVTTPDADVSEVERSLQAQLPHGLSVHRPARRGEQVESMVAAFRLNLLMLSGVGLLVGGFLTYNTLSFSIVQRRRDIGILRAVGLSEQGVSTIFLCEGLMYGVLGGAAGSVAGVALSQFLVGMVGRNISELYVSVAEVPTRWPTVRLFVPILLQGIALGGLLSGIGALIPAREASRTDVVDALASGGYELAAKLRAGRWGWTGAGLLAVAVAFACLPPKGEFPLFGYLSVLCLLLGLTALAPVLVGRLDDMRLRWRSRRDHETTAVSLPELAAAAAVRAPHRNGLTVSSLVVGLAITVGVIVMIRSFRHTVEIWIDQTVVADLIVTPVGWLHTGQAPRVGQLLPRKWADRIADVPGVEAVDTYRDVKFEIAGRPRTMVARDLRVHAERSRYLFLHGESRDVLSRTVAAKGVVVSEVLAGAANLSVGDDVTLDTPAGPKAFAVHGIFLDYATDGGKVVMDRTLFDELWGDDGATVIPVYLSPGADAHEVGRRINALVQAGDGTKVRASVLENAELRREILAIFDRTFRVTYVLEAIAVVIAMFGIVNTLLTAALERRRELATLQAIGAARGQIVGLLLWEAGYLGALGGLLGTAGGLGLAAILVWVINKQSFGWTIPLSVPWDVLALSLILAVGIAVAAAYWPARWIAGRSAVEGLRYE